MGAIILYFNFSDSQLALLTSGCSRDYSHLIMGGIKRRRLAAFLALCALIVSPSLFAAFPPRYIRFEGLVPESGGAPVAGISSILQDKEGFLWFGTVAGLARYDGREFRFFSSASEAEGAVRIRPTIVFPAIEDRRGDLWIGTDGQGLFRLDKDKEVFVQYTHDPADPASLGDDIVLAVQEDRNADLWIGTRLHGIDRFDRSKGTFSRVPLDSGLGAVWDLLADRQGLIWAGTQNGGLYRIDPVSGKTVNFRFDPNDPRSLGSNTVWSIFEDGQGTIWVGTRGGGLNRLVPETGRFIRFTGDKDHPQDLVSPPITAIAEESDGRLWIGTSWSGLRIWDTVTGEYRILKHDSQDPDSIDDDNITSLLRDASGIMWVGTARGGIQKSLAARAKFPHFKHDRYDSRSLSRNEVRSLWTNDGGRLWIGFDEGLDEIDEQTKTVRRFRHDPKDARSLSPGAVLALCGDGAGRIWAGTDESGLDCYDPRGGRFEHFASDPANPATLSNNRIYAIHPDRRNPGVLWIGTHRGLNRLETRTRRFTRYLHDAADASSLSGNIVTSLGEGESGFLWVGTRSGLNRMDKARGTFERYTGDIKAEPGTGLNDDFINCLYEDGSGTLWAGTNNGLNRFDPARNRWTYLTTQEGLPGPVVCGILEDGAGRLWISTNRGLARYTTGTGQVTAFGPHDGLQGDAFLPGAHFKSPGGRMLFGGANGLNAFRPEEVKDDPYLPPLAWTAFTRNGLDMMLKTPFSKTRTLKLSSRFESYEFEFAALDYAMPALNRFAFLLEPRDGDWVSLGTAYMITLSRLEPGDYRLRIKASTPDGVWNEKGIALSIRCVAPFWRTKGFIALIVLFFGSGAVAVARMRSRLKSALTLVGEKADAVIDGYELTTREKEILRLILQGAANKEIERRLFISSSTVRNHIYNIYQKLGVKNRIDLVNRINKDARNRA